ncbi:DCLK1 family protein [Megaselia abdita]
MEMTAAAAAAVVVAANHQLLNNHSSPSHAFKQGSSNCIVITLSQNNSPASSSSELDKDLQDLEINTIENDSCSNNLNPKLNGSLSMSSSASSTTTATVTTIAQKTTNKNRVSSSRTPTRKAKRIKFYRNGDKFFSGITIPVSTDRYRSFESLAEDLTKLLEDNVKVPGAVRNIYSSQGKRIQALDELEDGQYYVCCCNNEAFKKIEYNISSNQLVTNKANNRLSKLYRPSSPMKCLLNGSNSLVGSSLNGASPNISLIERDTVVHPRIVTLIRNGTKPRKIMRLLLNKRNSPTFEHVLTAITQVVKLDTGCVRKVFTVNGVPVLQLGDFFKPDEDVFFCYGNERVNSDDFKLESDESKTICNTRKTLRNGTKSGPIPKMPVKSKKQVHHSVSIIEDNFEELVQIAIENGIDIKDLPTEIRDKYALESIIGDGNFAIVLKVNERQTKKPFALKIIDKSKCKGKEHYIEAEVRVMKKLQHPYIISLIRSVDQINNMYLVVEYVSGGDLFDAITRVTKFSEDQSRVMIRHLASAMSYLHSMGIVHRDIKPENLLVELDNQGNVIELKLADFGLACEVTEPLTAVCGTPTYVAPEILMETGYALKMKK